jgi:hypothetical protein
MRRLILFILMIFTASAPAAAQGLIQDLLAGRSASGRPLAYAPTPVRLDPVRQRIAAPPRVHRPPVRLASLAPDVPVRAAPAIRISRPPVAGRPAVTPRRPIRHAAVAPIAHHVPATEAPRPVTPRASARLRDGDILVETDGIKVFFSALGPIAFEDANLPVPIMRNLTALAQVAPAAPSHAAPLTAAISEPIRPDGAVAPDGRPIRLIYP